MSSSLQTPAQARWALRNPWGPCASTLRKPPLCAKRIGLRTPKCAGSLDWLLRLWWNWQTRYFEVVVGQPVQVQVLLSAPLWLIKYGETQNPDSGACIVLLRAGSCITTPYLSRHCRHVSGLAD